MSAKKLVYTAFVAILFSVGVRAEEGNVHPRLSPVPQQIVWGEGHVSSSLKTIFGIRGDKAVRAWARNIPAHSEGYYLSISEKGIVVAGADSAGLFYGQQTLEQLRTDGNLPCVEITDWPSMPERGVIEGYYGNPYTHEARLRLFRFMGEQKMNVFIYGPKDDPYHRAQWRADYPRGEAERITALVDAARANHVKFVWAIHPGGDIRWQLADSLALVRKCEAMYRLGVRSFCVFFDDIFGEGSRGEKQAGLLNYLNDAFVHKHKDVDALMMCPTQYNKAWSGGNYLTTLGTQMDPSVRVMWTGATVVDMIDHEDMEWINAQLRRKAYIWLNYPVTDYCIDHLLMGPTFGNATDIGPMVSGFCSNPMEYCEASKVSLFSIADYTWHPETYDAEESWLLATQRLMPDEADAFRIFCDNNVDLGVTAHGLRREAESQDFVRAADDEGALGRYFTNIGRAASRLERSDSNPELMSEIMPWVKAMGLMANRGLMSLLMTRMLKTDKPEAFVQLYENYARSTDEQQALRSRDFRGSIKVATPAVASCHVEPWLRQRVADMIAEYKTKYDYRLDVFPQQVVENGTYFICDAAGRYLTDPDYATPGVKAVFRLDRDTINPQSQEWSITYNAITKRYSIINNQARRYLNEVGAFGRNPYNEEWNTYEITSDTIGSDVRYAIRNAGRGGRSWWLAVSDNEHIQYVNEAPTVETVFTWKINR